MGSLNIFDQHSCFTKSINFGFLLIVSTMIYLKITKNLFLYNIFTYLRHFFIFSMICKFDDMVRYSQRFMTTMNCRHITIYILGFIQDFNFLKSPNLNGQFKFNDNQNIWKPTWWKNFPNWATEIWFDCWEAIE